MKLNSREIATILHALRVLQCEGRIEDCAAGLCEHFENDQQLSNEEIDDLAERINCDVGADINPDDPFNFIAAGLCSANEGE
jgi:hypothetical protein